MRKFKKFLVAALAAVSLVALPQSALANVWANTYTWPDRNVTVRVQLECFGNISGLGGEDRCSARFTFEDFGENNIDHVTLYAIRLMVDRNANGGWFVLRADASDSTWTGGFGSDDSPTAACLHENQFPDDIRDGDKVRADAEYRIFWENGTSTVLRQDESPAIIIDTHAECN